MTQNPLRDAIMALLKRGPIHVYKNGRPQPGAYVAVLLMVALSRSAALSPAPTPGTVAAKLDAAVAEGEILLHLEAEARTYVGLPNTWANLARIQTASFAAEIKQRVGNTTTERLILDVVLAHHVVIHEANDNGVCIGLNAVLQSAMGAGEARARNAVETMAAMRIIEPVTAHSRGRFRLLEAEVLTSERYVERHRSRQAESGSDKAAAQLSGYLEAALDALRAAAPSGTGTRPAKTVVADEMDVTMSTAATYVSELRTTGRITTTPGGYQIMEAPLPPG